MFGIRHIAPTLLLKLEKEDTDNVYAPCIYLGFYIGLLKTYNLLYCSTTPDRFWKNESMLREAAGCSRSIAEQCPSGVFIILWKHKHSTIHQCSEFSLIFQIQHILFFENAGQNKASPMLLSVGVLSQDLVQDRLIELMKILWMINSAGFRKSNFVASQDHVEKLSRELQTHMAMVSEMQVG